MTDSERHSFSQGSFEEVLGSLSRRLSDPDRVTATVSDLLAVPDDPELDQHRTILRLSRDLDNRVSVVTTNFDTLLERAAVKEFTNDEIANISFAGQSIPAPGSAAFSGIIHIHGRLADRAIGLEPTPLVLFSADYGDAYMRSGWVSRFLFDLARCKTIVLVGYSASDAPVRYFLNVHEADRIRFPDLKPVYAFDAYEHDPKEASTAWGTLAVTPLPYRKATPHDHSPLWRDLAELGEVVDRPIPWRNEQAIAILDRTVADSDTKDRKKLRWLFGDGERRRPQPDRVGGHRDLWSVAIKTISDPKWFAVFQEERLWSQEEAAFVIAGWIARDFEDPVRLECACEWQGRLGPSFTTAVEQRLLYRNEVDRIWLRIWRIFCLVDPPIELSKKIRKATRRLKSDVTVYGDLERAVRLLAPSLALRESRQGIQPIKRLSDVVWPRMEIPDLLSIQKLIDALCDKQEYLRTLDLATAQLRSALYLEADLELITKEHDHNDFDVPSIEPHAQNRHSEGVHHLVRVLVKLLPAAAVMDRDRTRGLVLDWKSLPGRIGLRLCLHAMRDTELFEADEAMGALLSASEVDFCRNNREVPLLLKDRAGAASPDLTRQIEDRIIHGASDFYENYYPIEPGEVDWREHARDTQVWLRLTMLQEADVLSPVGVTELSAIRKRRKYLRRKVKDQDFFGSYLSESQSVAGNPEPIAEAAGDDRLRVASELRRRPEPEHRLGWSEYCRSDPQSAFDLLANAGLSSANGTLWNDFLFGIEFGHEASKPTRDDLAVKSFDHLANVSDDASLRPMASGLASLLMSDPRPRIADMDRWLRRLWDISTQLQSSLGHSTNVFELAIQEVAGKVTHTLLLEIDARKQNDKSPTAAQLELLSEISHHVGNPGRLGRIVLTHHLAFVVGVSQPCVDVIKERIDASDDEGKALRAVMLSNRITPDVTRKLRDAVLQGAIESKAVDDGADIVAANILRPALAPVPGDWGLTVSDVASVLRRASQSIRIGALEVLRRWIDENINAKLFWRDTIASFFDDVWPKEREFRNVSLTESFIGLVIAAGDEFPAAFKQIDPYMVPFDGESLDLHFISSSQAPEKYPEDVLSLLWRVCGPDSRGTFYSLAEIIDRLAKAGSKLEVDRRLQWLEHRAERYN